MSKELLRKKVLKKRKEMVKEEILSKSNKITKLFLESYLYNNVSSIMAYIDFRNEVHTEDLIRKSLDNNIKIIIPLSVVETRELILSQLINYDEELSAGTYGILEPKKEYIRKVSPSDIDLVIVPGVAFDERGYRIGYGGGYYDRFLSKLKPCVPKIALAFDLQIVDNAYEDKHDIPVDYIITETRIIKCNR